MDIDSTIEKLTRIIIFGVGFFIGLFSGIVTSIMVTPEIQIFQQENGEYHIFPYDDKTETKDIKHFQHEHHCLSEAIYFEAGNQPMQGKLAVGQVIMNRTKSKIYKNMVCDVVNMPNQFSYRDLRPSMIVDKNIWIESSYAALAVMANPNSTDIIGPNVLHYHASYIKPPSWTKKMEKSIQIGDHIFYES